MAASDRRAGFRRALSHDFRVLTAQLRAENKKLKAKNEKLARDLGKTKTALDIAGKAFALLEDISNSADSSEN